FDLGFFYLTPQTDAIYLYTPTDAPSKIIHDLWPLTEDNYVPGRAVTQSREAQVTVVAKDGGNILLPEYARSIKRLDMYIQNRIKVKYRNRTYTYRDLCLKWKSKGCPGNDHIQIISELYNHGINITYPTFRMGSRSGYLGAGLGGVSLGKDDNGTVILASARAWLLVYQLKFYPTNVSYISGVWEKNFKLHMDNYPEDPYISITYFHSQTLAEELKRTFYFDWVLSKPILSVFGVMNAGMGIASAMGGLVLLDVQYNDIVAVMPFLVVGKELSRITVDIRYAPILMQPVIKALAALWYCIYVGFAVYGCMHLKEGLEPVNLLIVVSSAPNLRDSNERQRVIKMVHDFANAPHAIGDESVQFWMKEMERYYRLEHNTTVGGKAFYEMASHYLFTHETEPWIEDVKWALDVHDRPYINAFRFLIGMRDISSTTEQQAATRSFREVGSCLPKRDYF
ncbi:hypothetical protein OESDEN_13168, partial [Oesophagostomum dentatum]